jgi:hypothetical protein
MGQAQGVSDMDRHGLQGGGVLGVQKKGCLNVADAVCQVWKEVSCRSVCRSNLSRNVVDAGVDGRQVQMASE